MKSQIDEELKEKMKNQFISLEQSTRKFIPGKDRIPLSVPSYSYEEVIEILDSLMSTYVTMGARARKFCSCHEEFFFLWKSFYDR